MDIPEAQANLAKVRAETMRLLTEVQETDRQQRRWQPFTTASGLLAVAASIYAFGVAVVVALSLH
jgi:hypothetical protein